MTHLSTIVTAVTPALLCIGGLTSPLAPAQSRPPGPERCPAGAFCLFEHANGTGLYVSFTTNGSKNLSKIGRGFNDKASLVINQSNRRWCIYKGTNFGTGIMYLPGQVDNLADGDGSWNDKTSRVLPAYYVIVKRGWMDVMDWACL